VQDAAWRFVHDWRTTTENEARIAKSVGLSPPRMSAWEAEVASGFLAKKYADPIFAALKQYNSGWGTPKGAPLWFPQFWDDIAFYQNQCMMAKDGLTPEKCWHTLALKIPDYRKQYGGDYPP
jgi:ABC-type glycerol-3-phosphate transport system substrate-binding protein